MELQGVGGLGGGGGGRGGGGGGYRIVVYGSKFLCGISKDTFKFPTK